MPRTSRPTGPPSPAPTSAPRTPWRRRCTHAAYPSSRCSLDLVVRAQRQVGHLWASNEWTVAREHAATAVSERVVHRLGEGLAEPATGPVLLVACAEREWHALPALVVSHTLRSWGHRVVYLGANATRDRLVDRVHEHGPRAVLLSASLSSSLPRVRRQVEAVRDTGTPVVLGGSAFDAAGFRARQLGATAYAATPAAAGALLATLPERVPPAPPLRHAAALEARTVQAGAETIAQHVTAATRLELGLGSGGTSVSPDDWRVVLTDFVPHVVDCLLGALLTADPTVLTDARRWLGEVLVGRGADAAAVDVLWGQLRRRLGDHPETLRLLDTV